MGREVIHRLCAMPSGDIAQSPMGLMPRVNDTEHLVQSFATPAASGSYSMAIRLIWCRQLIAVILACSAERSQPMNASQRYDLSSTVAALRHVAGRTLGSVKTLHKSLRCKKFVIRFARRIGLISMDWLRASLPCIGLGFYASGWKGKKI